MDPDRLEAHDGLDIQAETRAWSAVWSAGQGVAGFCDVPTAADLCDRLIAEYRAAAARSAYDPFFG